MRSRTLCLVILLLLLGPLVPFTNASSPTQDDAGSGRDATPEDPVPIVPGAYSGFFADAEDDDAFSFAVQGNETLRIHVRTESGPAPYLIAQPYYSYPVRDGSDAWWRLDLPPGGQMVNLTFIPYRTAAPVAYTFEVSLELIAPRVEARTLLSLRWNDGYTDIAASDEGVLLLRDDGLHVHPHDPSTPVRIAPADTGAATILIGANDTLAVRNTWEASIRLVQEGPDAPLVPTDYEQSLALGPGGIYAWHPIDTGPDELVHIDIPTGERTVLLKANVAFTSLVAPRPDGTLALAMDNLLYVFDPASGHLRKLAPDLPGYPQMREMAVDAAGNLLLLQSNYHTYYETVYHVNAETGRARVLWGIDLDAYGRSTIAANATGLFVAYHTWESHFEKLKVVEVPLEAGGFVGFRPELPRIAAPDLVIADITVADVSELGENLDDLRERKQVRVALRNDGDATARAPFDLGVDTWGPVLGTITAHTLSHSTDRPAWWYTQVQQNLAPGETLTIAFDWNTTLVAGNFTIIARVDPLGSTTPVLEHDERNNKRQIEYIHRVDDRRYLQSALDARECVQRPYMCV